MLKVILKAKHIPLNSTVTKRTGLKEYVLCDILRVFDPEKHKEIHRFGVTKGLFLCNGGDANVIDPNLELVWIVEEQVLEEYLRLRDPLVNDEQLFKSKIF